MDEPSIARQPPTPIPADDSQRPSKLARPDADQSLPHFGLVGDTRIFLPSGEDTRVVSA